jgi:hypothetical protein
VFVVDTFRAAAFGLAVLLCGLAATTTLAAAEFHRGSIRTSWPMALVLAAGALCGVAAWDVPQRPRLWTALPALGLAAAAAFAGAGAAASGWAGPGLAVFLVLALPAAALLAGAGAILRMGPVLRNHPDLEAARRQFREPRLLPEAEAGRKAREFGRREDLLRRRRILLWGVGTVAAAGGIAIGSWFALHPPPDAAVAEFREAWTTADWGRIEERFEPYYREGMAKGLRALLVRRGWEKAPPALEAPVVKEGRGGTVEATYWTGTAQLRTTWKLRNGRWALTGIRLPE